MKKHLLLFLLALFTATLPGLSAEKTISLTGKSGEASIINDDPFSISFAKNSASNPPTFYDDGVRIYYNATKGGSITIANNDNKKITSIVLTYTSSSYTFPTTAPNSGTLANSGATGTWVASSDVTSVTFTNTQKDNKQVRISQLVITYEESTSGGGDSGNTGGDEGDEKDDPEPTPGETSEVTFDFVSNDYDLPRGSDYVNKVTTISEGVVNNQLSGGSEWRLWGDGMRAYTTGNKVPTMTFSVPNGLITEISFTGESTNFKLDGSSSNLSDSKWTGQAETVKLVYTGTSGKPVKTITVKYILNGGSETPEPKEPEEFTFDSNVPTEMTVGDTYTLQLGTTLPKNFKVITTENDIVSITESAPYTLKALKEGKAKFIASWEKDENFTAGEKEFTITVSKKTYAPEFAESYTLSLGETLDLKPMLRTDRPDMILTDVEPSTVGEISEDFVFTPNAAGLATVTLKWGDEIWKDGEAEFTVNVTAPEPPKTITINPPVRAIDTNTEIELSADGNATITYSIDNENYDQPYNKPFTLNVGTHTVYVKATNLGGSITASAQFTVSEYVAPTTAEALYDFPTMYSSNATIVDIKLEKEDIELTFSKGNASNAPQYYASGTAVRAYGGSTFTVKGGEGCAYITKVEITSNSGGDDKAITANVGNYTDGTTTQTTKPGVWTATDQNTNEIVFTVASGSGNRRIMKINVTYVVKPVEKVAPSEVTITPNGGEIDTNTKITVAVDEAASKPLTITYSVDEKTYSETYSEYIKLPEGTHTLYVKAANEKGSKEVEAIFNVAKGPEQYQIVFSDNGSDDSAVLDSDKLIAYIESGKEYVTGASGITSTYKGVTGLKLGSSSTAGKFTLNLSDAAKVTPTRIIISAAQMSDNETASIKVNNFPTVSIQGTALKDYIIEVSDPELLETLTIEESLTGKHRCYVKAITVDYGEATVQQPELSIADGSEVLKGTELTVTCATKNAKLYGTIGSKQVEGVAMPYTVALDELGEIEVDLYAVKDNYVDSEHATATYTVYQQVAAPVLNVENGASVERGTYLEVTCTTDGAKLYGTINGEQINGETVPFRYRLMNVGENRVEFTAKADGYRDSGVVNATFTVTAVDAPVIVFDNGTTIVEEETTIHVTATGAEKVYVTVYDIDGTPTVMEFVGEEGSYTVDKMHRRFEVAAENELAGRTIPIEKFYRLGVSIDDAIYTRVTNPADLVAGDKIVIGITHAFQNKTYYGFMGGLNEADRLPNIKNGASFVLVEDEQLKDVDEGKYTVEKLSDEVLVITVENAPNGGFYLKTENGYLYSSNVSQNSDMKLVEKAQATVYTPKYEANIKEVLLSSPNNDTDATYCIQLNTQGPIFASYRMLINTPAQWPASIFKYTEMIETPIEYPLSFSYTPHSSGSQVRAMAVGDSEDVVFTDGEDGGDGYTEYTTTAVTNLMGEFTLNLGGMELKGDSGDAETARYIVSNFHSHEKEPEDDQEDTRCKDPNPHAPYIYLRSLPVVGEDVPSATTVEEPQPESVEVSGIKLINAANEAAMTISTNANTYHGFVTLHPNPTISVSVKPFYGVTMGLASTGDDVATSVVNVSVDAADGATEYYNLQGVRVDGRNLQPGRIYIVRRGTEVTKQLVK